MKMSIFSSLVGINKDMELSIITIVNNLSVYQGFVNSLKDQTYKNYELLPVDNCGNQHISARALYNNQALKAKGKYILFTHPDIRFNTSNSLQEIINVVNNIEKPYGILGVAGAPDRHGEKRVIYSTILQGKEKGDSAFKKIDVPVEVQTVDECFFIVKREEFLKHNFHKKNGWHLYAVELCLDAILRGEKNYVIPADIWHMSAGNSLDPNYVKQVKNLTKEYSKDFPYIYTTVKLWKTRGIDSKLYLEYYFLKQQIKKIAKR